MEPDYEQQQQPSSWVHDGNALVSACSLEAPYQIPTIFGPSMDRDEDMMNNLRPWSLEEDSVIAGWYLKGSSWRDISMLLAGRTENEIQHYWETELKQKLTRIQGVKSSFHPHLEQHWSPDMTSDAHLMSALVQDPVILERSTRYCHMLYQRDKYQNAFLMSGGGPPQLHGAVSGGPSQLHALSAQQPIPQPGQHFEQLEHSGHGTGLYRL